MSAIISDETIEMAKKMKKNDRERVKGVLTDLDADLSCLGDELATVIAEAINTSISEITEAYIDLFNDSEDRSKPFASSELLGKAPSKPAEKSEKTEKKEEETDVLDIQIAS